MQHVACVQRGNKEREKQRRLDQQDAGEPQGRKPERGDSKRPGEIPPDAVHGRDRGDGDGEECDREQRAREGPYAGQDDAARVAAVRKRTGPRKFQAQMMLEPVAETAGRLDPDRLLVYDDDLVYYEGNDAAIVSISGRRMSSVTCWWDPAYGSPDGDRSVVAAVFTDAEGHYWLHDIAYLAPPSDTEKKGGQDDASHYCRQVAAFAKRNRVPHVTIEQNGIGRFLPSILRRELASAGLACGVAGVNAVRAKTLTVAEYMGFAPLTSQILVVKQPSSPRVGRQVRSATCCPQHHR